jgi:hypothetical protein
MRIRWNDIRQRWEVWRELTVVASFDKCHQAEAWVIAESKAREGVA